MTFGTVPKKFGRLPIVPDVTLPGPNLSQADPVLLKMAQKDTFSHFFTSTFDL